ncbi:HD domain-containing protein [Patescibacteria group bacterium]|nr:HD domain-containing protein [Patescibacteria group bacterium]
MLPEVISFGGSIGDIEFNSEKLVAAYNLASKSHDGIKRKSGEPYFSHCVEVLKILVNEWGITNDDYLAAALLHDTVEDTKVTLKQIQAEFGEGVVELVDGVTKLQTSNDLETLKKVLSKTYLNPGVAIIKLADRLHNMRTLGFVSPEKQVEKASETLDVYTRLAESLGMWQVKTELEDWCFQYLDLDGYKRTKQLADSDPRLNPFFSCNVQSRLEQLLGENNIDGGKVEVRKNGYWTLREKQEKLSIRGKGNPDNFNDINDLVSFRVQLGSPDDCYKMLRVIHESFGEMVDYERFDEFIGANKRMNGYEALQTTINFSQGPVEIVLVTDEMERFNRWGVISLIKKGNVDLRDYVLKFVFTPTGSIRFLPKNATGVDFALMINLRVLAEANSISVDGQEKPLTYVIPNASTVRVNLGEVRRAPLAETEDYCLPQTRKVILEQRRLQRKDILIKNGQAVIEGVLRPRGLLVLTDLGDSINPVLYKLGCQGADDLYFMVGNGFIKQSLIEKELDEAGITKEALGLTSIKLKGKDRPKILVDVVQLISNTNKNIIHIAQDNDKEDFELRILIKDLSPEEEEMIRKGLSEDKRFTEVLVV